MSPNILWHMKYEPKIILILYVQIRLQMWINVKNIRFEGTNHKRGITGTIEMSRNTPPGEIPSGMYIY